MIPTPNILMPVNTLNPVNAAHPMAGGLGGWWMPLPHSSGGTQLRDLCGKNHGTLTNMVLGTEWRGTTCPGHAGEIVFDGTNDRIALSLPSGMGANNWTIGAWAKPSVSPTLNDAIIAIGNDSGGYTLMFAGQDTTNTNIYLLLNGVAWVNTGATFAANTWYHIMASRSGTTITIMVNGQQVATSSATPLAPAGDANLGWETNTQPGANGVRGLTGALADAFIYTRGMSATEMAQHYQLSRAGYPGLLNRIDLSLMQGLSSGIPLSLLYRRYYQGAL